MEWDVAAQRAENDRLSAALAKLINCNWSQDKKLDQALDRVRDLENRVVPPHIAVAPDSPLLLVSTSTAPNKRRFPNSRNQLPPSSKRPQRESSPPRR